MPPCTCMARSAASQQSRFAQKLHIDTLSESVCSTCACVSLSISHAVLRMSNRSISACVANSTSGHWIAWFSASARPNGLRLRAYFTLSSMQYTAAPSELAACRMRFSCTKHCASDNPRPISPNSASSGTKTSVKLTRGWSVGMLKVHIYSSTFTPPAFAGTRKQVMPRASPSLPLVRANSAQWVATCIPVVHIFSPLITQPATPPRFACTARVSMGRVRPMFGLGEAKGDAVFSGDGTFDHRLLVVAAVAVEHCDQRKVADDGMFVLQIVMQAKSLGGKMLADHGHPEIGAILAAVAFRDREAQVPGIISKIFHPSQQRFPLMPRQPAILEIGARPFAAMIEETDIVVRCFDRLDLARDELIELGEIRDQVGRQCEIQGSSPRSLFCR